MYKRLVTFVIALALTLGMTAQNKREFRGAWIQCVNGQFMGKSTQEIQTMLSNQLDELQKDGVNAIIFQVRAECDALYESDLEPWSKFLTGVQGKAPSPYWDPLAWMVEQCHQRGMELHAWINPYRAKHGSTSMGQLSDKSVVVKQPNLCFSYDNLVLLNPGLKEAADYTCKVAADIVKRYDIDGFHIDDYFYPYPVAGKKIPDQELFQKNSHGFWNIGDWRRDNVSRFIKQLGETIHQVKPWVKFGVSPFGIYRNKRNDPNGSETNGLQNYDDLYADVLLWVNNGWIDYCVPQLYWEIGNRAADYKTLITWWNKNAGKRPLYIGEDIERTAKYADPANPKSHQLPAKHKPLTLGWQLVAGSHEKLQRQLDFAYAVAEQFLIDDREQGVLYGRACLPYLVEEYDIGCRKITFHSTLIGVGGLQFLNAHRTEDLIGRREARHEILEIACSTEGTLQLSCHHTLGHTRWT